MEELIYLIDWEQVKNNFDIFMWGDPNIPVHKGWVQIAAAAIGLVVSGAQALSAKKRRKKALDEYRINKAAFKAQEITNPYENLENPYEDLTVNQKQARFLAQQQQLGLATTLSNLRGAAGGAGVASLAQSVANIQSRNLQGISGSIGQQEARNQQLSAQGQLQIDAMKGQGEQARQIRESQRTGTLLGMSQMDVAGEQQRLDSAVGGVASSVGMLGGAIQDQVALKNIQQQRNQLSSPSNNSGSGSGTGTSGSITAPNNMATGAYNPLGSIPGLQGYGVSNQNTWGTFQNPNAMDFWNNRGFTPLEKYRIPEVGYYSPYGR